MTDGKGASVLVQRSVLVQGLVEGRRVYLEYDPAGRCRDHLDDYERMLTHIWTIDQARRPEHLLSGVPIRRRLLQGTCRAYGVCAQVPA